MRAARAGQTAADASLIDAVLLSPDYHQSFSSVGRGQLLRVEKPACAGPGAAQGLGGQAQGRSATRSDSLRSLVNLGTARLDQITLRPSSLPPRPICRLIGITAG